MTSKTDPNGITTYQHPFTHHVKRCRQCTYMNNIDYYEGLGRLALLHW
jgi:hypothetical protein